MVLCLFFCLIPPITFVSTHWSVRAELHRLYTVFVYMRRKAIIDQQTYSIIFSTHSYQADTDHQLSDQVQFGAPVILGPPGDPQKKIAHYSSWPADTVHFYADGTISSGAVYLTDSSRRCTYALTADASAVTGLRRYEYRGYKHRGYWLLL